MVIIITGSNGFTSKYLAAFIKSVDIELKIIGIDVQEKNINTNIDVYFSTVQYPDFINYCRNISEQVKFFHTAGVLRSDEPSIFLLNNVEWTFKFLQIASEINNLSVFLNVGSSAEYGYQELDVVDETLLPNPVTIYGVTKHKQTQMVLYHSNINKLNVICTRTFNLIGTGLNENLLFSKILNEFMIAAGSREKIIHLLNTDSVRDYNDVRDVVRYYWLLTEQKEAFGKIINIGKGKGYSVHQVVHYFAERFGFLPKIICSEKILTDPQTIKIQIANISKVNSLLSFPDRIGIKQTISDMVDDVMK